ncbi:MAG: DUF899 domain-containing protein [Myxococcales bacterium]|nr:DUF899 domain-containing protein [Myxococcales bacterium]
MSMPSIVDLETWTRARQELLEAEKAHMRASDALAARRRRLPMVEVEASHRFVGPEGSRTLLQLFDGAKQLIAYHFMLPAGGQPCTGCSMVVDQLPHLAHLRARDTALVLTSRAPQHDIAAVKERLGWTVPWLTVEGEAFYEAVGIETGFGLDVFVRDGERVFRTFSVTGRGVESLGTTWALLDLTPLGRQETWEDTPQGRPQSEPYRWWRLHDDYAADLA